MTPATKKRLPRVCLVLYLLTALSAGLYFAFTKSPALSDFFNRFVSTWGRRALAALTSWVPFSVAELLLILLPLWLTILVVIGARHYCDSNRDLFTYIGILLSGLCVVAILFVWNFAPGYYGTPLDKKLGLDRTKSSAADLFDTAELLRGELEEIEEEIIFLESGRSMMPYSLDVMNEKLLDAYDAFCMEHDFLDTYSSRIKPVMLSEPMSYTHITGVYTFFTGEANVNVNFPDYSLPFTAAHELAHQRGIAREDEANFVAFLICMESDDPYLRYSALLSLYEYVGSALYTADAKLYRESYLALPRTVQAEEDAYRAFFEKYRDNVAADVSDAVNNGYLQSQGAAEGTRSYGMVVDLAVAYFRKAGA